MKRKLLSIITALALCLSLCPTWALAEEGEPGTVRVSTAEELQTAVADVNSTGGTVTILLTADIDLGSEGGGIVIEKGDVTLDCGGHTLSGSGGSTIVTFYKDPDPSLTVRNGTVKNSGSSGSYCINNMSDNALTVEKSAAIIAEGKQGRGIYTTGKAINIYGRVAGTSCGICIAYGCELNLYSGAVITGNWQTIKIDVSEGTTINLMEGAKAYLNTAEITSPITTDTGSGVLIICSNHQIGILADGSISCPTCGFREQAAAMVEKDNAAPVYVTSLPDAFKEANSGATVTLLADVSLRETITLLAGEFTLNLNGKTVSADSQVFTLSKKDLSGGTSSLTVKGEGGIVSNGSNAIVVSGGALTVDGGTIQTKSDTANAIDAFSGTVTVNGGHIIAKRDANYSAAALYVNGTASAGINGGTFTGGVGGSGTITLFGGVFESVTSGGVSVWTDSSLSKLLGSGGDSRCVFFDGNGNPITGSKLEGGKLTGTVTVKWCDHPQAARGYTITESTHQAVCTICEMELGDSESHKMDSSKTYCTVCGYYPKPVQVAVDGNAPVRATLEEAWAKALTGTNATVTLLSDVLDNTPGSSMTLAVPAGKTITLVGGGHSLGNGGFRIMGGTLAVENCGIYKGWVMTGGEATFRSCWFNGKFVSGVPAINIDAGTVGFDSCTFTDNLEVYLSSNNARFTDCTFTNVFVGALAGSSTFKGCKTNGILQDGLPAVGVSGTAEFTDCTINTPTGNCIEVVGDTGAAIIHSGTYTAGEGYSALYVASTGKTQLRGGSFSGIEIADTTGDVPITTTLPGLLGHTETTRYAYYQDGRRVLSEGKEFHDPVAVGVCSDHPAEHVADTLTHTRSCAYCGYTAEAEPCSYAFTFNEGTCSACGDIITVTAAEPKSLIYDGNLKAFTVAVTRQNGSTLMVDTDYTTAYTGGTNAGKASLDVTIGQNQGTYTREFTVQPKSLTVAGITVKDRVYDGTNQVEITGVTPEGGIAGDEVLVNTSGLTGTLSGTDVGTYTAVTLPVLTLTGEKAANYTLTQPSGAMAAKVTISKAPALAPKTGDLAVANGRAYTYIYGLGSLRPDVPAGQSLGSTAVTYELGGITLGDYYTTGAKIEGQALTLPIQAVDSEAEEEIGTVEVIIHTGNFEDMRATIHVRSVNKAIPEGAPTLSTGALTYGQALSAITLSGGMKDGDKDVPGTFAWSSPDNRPAVQESYAAAWVFTPDDNAAYAIVNGISAIQVVPAPIADAEITLSETAYRYDGAAHSPGVTSVKLGNVTLTEGADYVVDVPAGTEAGRYTVTVTGRGNYTGTAAVTFTVNPVEPVDIDQKDDSGRDLRLEVETGLSRVPAGLTGMEAYNTTEKIETALRVQVSEQMPNVGGNISVFDVTLQYKDESGNWQNVDPNNFPAEGVTAILPYPAGTGSTGWRFTVQHLISSGNNAGEMETLTYTLTADGLRCKFTTLSPVAIGYQEEKAPDKPDEPDKPEKPDKPARPGNSGGGSAVSTYAVTVEKPEHGKVTASRTSAGSGSTVTLTVTPDSGYALDALTVTDSRGNEVELTAQGEGKYTFTMPGRAVTVTAVFAPLPEEAEQPCDGGADCPSRAFADLGAAWYHEAVDYVLQNGLMSGHSSGLFGPNDTLTRAQFAQILYNRAGRPAVTGGSAFPDVAPGAWCAPAVTWAAANGIVGGYSSGLFGPDDNITREQLAVMLWRYAGSPAAAGGELPFTDADRAGSYALEALCWAVENGIVGGSGDGQLAPQGPASRAQAAQMLMNFLKDG